MLASAAGLSAYADPPSIADVEAWARRELEAAAKFPLPPNTKAVYATEWHKQAAPREIEQLRIEVEGKPDHPKRDEYEKLVAYEAGKLDIEQFTIWSQESGKWRMSIDYEGRLLSRSPADYVLMPGRAWQRSHDIVLIDPDQPTDRYDLAPSESAFCFDLRLFLYGGLGLVPMSDAKLKVDGIEADGFVIRVTQGSDIEVEVRCVWDSSKGTGNTLDARMLRALNGHAGRRFIFSDWADDEAMGDQVARRVENYAPSGNLEQVLVWRGSSSIDEAEFQALTDDPSPDRADPIRGDVTVKRVKDLRTTTPSVAKKDDDGHWVTKPMADTPASRSRRWMKYAGWASAITLILTLFAFRIKKSIIA